MSGVMSYWGVQGSSKDEEKEREEQAKRQALLRQFLTPEARERLRRVSLVKPDLAKRVEDIIIQLGVQGRLDHRISDSELKNILARVQTRKDFRIRGF